MKRYLAPVLCSVLVLASWIPIKANAQATEAQRHVAAAKAATYRPGHDFTPLFDQICAEPRPAQPAPAAQPAAAPAARRIPPRSDWYKDCLLYTSPSPRD